MQPTLPVSSPSSKVSDWLEKLGMDDACDGWNVALLRVLGKLSFLEKERFSIVHSQLIREALQRKGSTALEKCEDVRKLSFALACCALPTLTDLLRLEFSSPVELALKTRGRFSYEVCKFIFENK